MRTFIRLGLPTAAFIAIAAAALGLGACSDSEDERPGINRRPVVDALEVSGDEDTSITIDFLSSSKDPDGQRLRVASASISGTQVQTDAFGKASFFPPKDFHGKLVLAFSITDGEVSVGGVGLLTVRQVQDPVTATSVTRSLREDEPLTIPLEVNDVDGDVLTFAITRPPAHGTVSGVAPNLVYTPAANYNGSDSLTYEVSDGASTATANVGLTILPVNDVPTAASKTISLAEDSALAFALEGSDVEGSPLTYVIVQYPSHGVLLGSGANVTYQPAANYHGPDELLYQVIDGASTSNTATVTIDVTGVDDPTTALPVTVTATEDTAAAVTLRGADGDGTPLVYTVGTPAHGTLTGTAPALTYTPSLNYNGSDSFSYTVTSEGSDPATATVTVNIAAVNDAPVAGNVTAATAEDTSVVLQLVGSDVDSSSLGYSLSISSQDGTITGSGATRTFTPAANINGSRTFTYYVSDEARSSSATVTVTITPVNDAPVALVDYVATDANEPLDIAALVNDLDIEGDALSLQSLTSPLHGTAVIEGGLVVYTPDADFTGEDVLSYTIADALGATATGFIRVGVDTFLAGAPNQTLVATTASGFADDHRRRPSISNDGRFIAFSTARSLLPADTNSFEDVYVYDRGHQTLRLASMSSTNGAANERSRHPHLAGNGRYLVFWSSATNLIAGGTTGDQVFRRDLRTGETLLISVSTAGQRGNNSSYEPKISDDGNRVVFTSYAFNLVPGDTNGVTDIFLRDVAAATTTRLSVGSLGGNVDLGSTQPVISGDGKVVAFSSEATNLVPGDSNALSDVFTRNLDTNVTQRVSVSTNGVEGNGGSSLPSLSSDGQFVSFASFSNNLVAGRNYGTFVRDVASQTTSTGYGSTGYGNQLSGDGRYLTVHNSITAALVDRFAGASSVLTPPSGSRWDWPVLSGNGKYIVVIENPSGAIIVMPNPR